MVNSFLEAVIIEDEEPFCVRYTNTVAARRGSEPEEYFKSPGALRDWLVSQSLLPSGVSFDEPSYRRGIELRDSLYRIFSAIAAGNRAEPDDVDILNGELTEALAKIELTDQLEWTLSEGNPLEKAFMAVALSAANLITSPLVGRIRECANDTCGWIFVDRSKNRSRRWCSMSDCGNLEKARRFQARKRESQS